MIVTKSSFAGFASALALTGLSGCTTFNRSDADVAKVIEGTRQACKFIPTATSVLAVLSVPGAPAADKLVQIICKQVGDRARFETTIGGELTVMVNGQAIAGTLSEK